MTTMHSSVAVPAEVPRVDEETYWNNVDKYVMRTGVSSFPEVITSARGTYMYTNSGRPILDFTSGQMSAILGHSNPAIVEAVKYYMDTLDHTFTGIIPVPAAELCERLTHTHLPANLTRTILLSTGSETTEMAIRLAKFVTGKFEVVALSRSWHGLTTAAASATYSHAASRSGFGPNVPGNIVIPAPNSYRPDFVDADGELDWEAQLEFSFRMIDLQSVGSLAACIIEPILSAGGMLELPKGYMKALQDKCRERGMLLIVDEAQTGLCRTGDWYGFLYDEGVTPDIVAMSKTLGAGLPLGAVIATEEVEQIAYEHGFHHATTHAFDPMVAGVGLAVLDVLESTDMIAQVRESGALLRKGLDDIHAKHERVGDVRGRGLLQGIELVTDRESKQSDAAFGAAVTQRCLELGLHMNISQARGQEDTFRIAPPLTASLEEIQEGIDILEQSIADCSN